MFYLVISVCWLVGWLVGWLTEDNTKNTEWIFRKKLGGKIDLGLRDKFGNFFSLSLTLPELALFLFRHSTYVM